MTTIPSYPHATPHHGMDMLLGGGGGGGGGGGEGRETHAHTAHITGEGDMELLNGLKIFTVGG